MESGLFLNVVVRQGTTIFKLLASKDEALLVGRDALLVLDFRLHVVDRVRRFYLEGNRLPRQRLDKDLHASTKTKDQMESRLFLNVVVRKSTTVLKLLSGENQTLLIWWNTLLVLDLGLDVVDSIR
ncbi:hypothetical protein CPB85DRAFT_1268593 [Mucidula mucida]|nr:hypothetical protein CPB85DRAFT_1268593 [Mucidula mucida]